MTTPADDMLADIERRLKELEPRKVEAVVMPSRKEAAPAPAKSTPRRWVFIPVRDQNDLIVRIDAEAVDNG